MSPRPELPFLAVLTLMGLAAHIAAAAEDWGAYSLSPAGAPGFVLEAVGAGAADGTPVSINKPSGEAHQKWTVVAKGDGLFAVKPAHAPSLALTAAKAGEKAGTPVVLEADGGKPNQLWRLNRLEGGTYALSPQHVPGMGLDHFGGKAEPGAAVDLWTYKESDRHLHWLVRPLAGTGVAEPKADAAPAYQPPATRPQDVRPGETKQLRFAASKVFPGTVRDVTVFVPAQYDAKVPACVYVKTDGFNPGEKTLLEAMIATKEMPVTVGVFVRPGDVPAPMPGTLGRRNRDLEYDGVGDENVRFLVDELLPFVARECSLNLSTDGNDRCIAGSSSGGIAAFTAAWHRPDAFSRVYAASGNWVAFRGGHEFPTMVRKFEARPIRSFLTTATRDMENCAGDWFLLDQEMDKALTFAGYDHQFRVVDGPHVAGYADHWREAMAYLWRGWPERVTAGPSAPRARDVILPGEGWKLVAEGFKSTRGPACNAAGEVFFADTTASKIHRVGVDGKVGEFVAHAGSAHCVTVGPDGSLFTVSEKSGKLMRYDPAGKPSVVMEGIVGHSVLARPDGSLYVTANGEQGTSGTVWLVKDGKKTKVDGGIKFATGMAYRPDRWLLSVAEGHSKWVYSYQVNEDGPLANKERFFQLHVADADDDAGAESVCYSIEGRQFVATRTGVQITADDGPTQVILPVPGNGRVTGVALGGKDKDTLYAFCGNKVWMRKVREHAMGAFSPWAKVAADKL